MDTNNFILEITKAVQQLLGHDYNVFHENVTKNNSLSLTGLVIQHKGSNISPTIYIDEFLDSYEEGISIDLIAEQIIKIYKEHKVSTAFDASEISDYEKAKNRIIFQLINTERNADLLKTIPSVGFLDFSIIFKIYFGSSPMGCITTTITNALLDLWNVSADAVYEVALRNTPVLQEYSLKDMQTVIMDITGINVNKKDEKPDAMYVLTNKQSCCGCGCILYPHVLEDFAEQMGSDFYILPSSKHEVILLLAGMEDPHSLIQIVREVNRTQVEQEDFLSDNVYRYSRETKEITIIQ